MPDTPTNTISDMLDDLAPDALFKRLVELAGADREEDEAPEPARATHVSKLPAFELEGAHEQVRAAHKATMDWLEAAERKARPYWLSLLGKSGCGKTHLLRLARAVLKDRGCGVVMTTWREALDNLRSGGDFMRHLVEQRYLLIDDVGAEFNATAKAMNFSHSALCELADARIHRWTMLTSNLSLKDLAEEELRVASRLVRHGNLVYPMDQAPDYAMARYRALRANQSPLPQQ